MATLSFYGNYGKNISYETNLLINLHKIYSAKIKQCKKLFSIKNIFSNL